MPKASGVEPLSGNAFSFAIHGAIAGQRDAGAGATGSDPYRGQRASDAADPEDAGHSRFVTPDDRETDCRNPWRARSAPPNRGTL